MSVLRSGLHYLAGQRRLQSIVTHNRLSARMARRFVAGETLDEAIDAVRRLNQRGLRASLDYLGESVASPEEAAAAADTAERILDEIARAGVDSNISIKLTQLGLDVDDALGRANVERIVAHADRRGNFVRLDMEGSAYTQRTLDLFETVNARYPGRSGVVLQAYLHRTAADVNRMVELGVRVRLCKGAYQEPADIAFPDKADVDRNYVQLAKRLLEAGTFPAMATHDESIIRWVCDFTRRHGIGPERFEFQMLYGVRRDLQQQLVDAGYGMRVYVPFGSQWYPYFMRRLAERPANVVFLLSSVARDRG